MQTNLSGIGAPGRPDRELRSLFFALSFLRFPEGSFSSSLFPVLSPRFTPTGESPRGYSIRSGGFEKEDWSCPGGLLPPSCFLLSSQLSPSRVTLTCRVLARGMPRIKPFSGSQETRDALFRRLACPATPTTVDRSDRRSLVREGGRWEEGRHGGTRMSGKCDRNRNKGPYHWVPDVANMRRVRDLRVITE